MLHFPLLSPSADSVAFIGISASFLLAQAIALAKLQARYIQSDLFSIWWKIMLHSYTMPTAREGIDALNRDLLEKLHRNFPSPFEAVQAASALDLSLTRARRLLAYLAVRGWLSRIRRGFYSTVPLGASVPSEWREDPWVVAARLYEPGYIGGFSACEHWSLTEQVFRDLVVFTTRPLRNRKAEIQGTTIRLKRIEPRKLFGLSSEWRGQVRVKISDPSRTIVDILDTPALGGGMRHVATALQNYFESDQHDQKLIIAYAEKLGNRTVFKRLGFLLETLLIDAPEAIEACRSRMSTGLSPLDPGVRSRGKILKRWNLRVNITLPPESEG